MKQVTLRLAEELVDRVKSVAADRGESVNAFAASVLSAAVDPETAGSGVERMRERLARAGILTVFDPLPEDTPMPTDEELEQAAREAGRGKPLSDYVIEGRGPR